MHGGTQRYSHISFPINPKTILDVNLVHLHFRETIPQARQSISHRKIRVNNEMDNITCSKVSLMADPKYYKKFLWNRLPSGLLENIYSLRSKGS
jgi:hypothetical protein